MPKIVKKVAQIPRLQRKTRVAAYARVSSGKDTMLHSLSAQVSYYNDLIQKEDGWEFAGVYSDEAITGTKEARPGFQQMLEDCRNGKIDLILTKSISRFARNTVTLLETVRMLKALGVDVYFEEQNIHTISADGELMLTILASYAQEESRSVSENQKWRVQKNFEEGIPWSGRMLGYRMRDGQYHVIPEEAEVVRRIFREYLEGNGSNRIAAHLQDDGIPTMNGGIWNPQTIAKRTTFPKRRLPIQGKSQSITPKKPMKLSYLWKNGWQCKLKSNVEPTNGNRLSPPSPHFFIQE